MSKWFLRFPSGPTCGLVAKVVKWLNQYSANTFWAVSLACGLSGIDQSDLATESSLD